MTQEFDNDAGIDLIRDRISDGSLTLTIKSLPMGGGKQPTFKTEDGGFAVTAEEQAAMNAIAKRYGDTLIELDDVDETYEGLERVWQIGSILFEAESFDDDFSRTELLDLLHIEGVSSTQAQRFVKVFEMFPLGDFNDDHTYTLVTELATRADSPEDAYTAYRRMDDAGFTLTQYEARAWGHVEQPTLVEIAANISKYVNAGLDTQVRGVRRLFTVFGVSESDQPTDAEIEIALNSEQ